MYFINSTRLFKLTKFSNNNVAFSCIHKLFMNVQYRTLAHGQRLKQFDVDLSDHVMSCCKCNDRVVVFLSKYQRLCHYHANLKGFVIALSVFLRGGGVLFR